MWLLIVLVVLALLALVVLAAVAAVAAAVAIAAHLLPWILILAGAWLLIRALRGPDQHQPAARGAGHAASARPRPWTGPVQRTAPRPARPAPAPRTTPEPRAAARPSRELPVDVQVKVEQIRRKAEMLLGFADRFLPFSQDLYIVRQTTADYLPRTIEAYLALPGEGDPVVGPEGRTALDELRSQLQLLDARLDDIAQDLQRQDVGRLLANRRFLEERFGRRDRPVRADPAGSEIDAA